MSLSAVAVTIAILAARSGPLVIVGGGGTPEDVRQEFVRLAGGKTAVIAVLPQASNRPDRGKASVAALLKAGAAKAFVVELKDSATARTGLQRATAVWFPGGSQAALYKALKAAGLVEFLKDRHKAGVVFGGTSAGAAIMSSVLIPRTPKQQRLTRGNTPVMTGLGLAPALIIDQHFVARRRMNRLLGAVIDHPKRIGVGIGESTAIVVRNGAFTVKGTGSVVVIDARKAKVTASKPGSNQSAQGILIHVLKAGSRFRFQTKLKR